MKLFVKRGKDWEDNWLVVVSRTLEQIKRTKIDEYSGNSMCYAGFARMSGIRLKPGEIKVIEVKEVKE